MNKHRRFLCLLIAAVLCATLLPACAGTPKKTTLKAIIIPKFEVGEMSGDFPGEAQLFYEEYCMGCEEIEISHMPPSTHFYVNPDNGVGILKLLKRPRL